MLVRIAPLRSLIIAPGLSNPIVATTILTRGVGGRAVHGTCNCSNAGSDNSNHSCIKGIRRIVSTENDERTRRAVGAYSATSIVNGTTLGTSHKRSSFVLPLVERFNSRSGCFMGQTVAFESTSGKRGSCRIPQTILMGETSLTRFEQSPSAYIDSVTMSLRPAIRTRPSKVLHSKL